MADRVFSVTDFKEGLDVRKTPLTAPGGSLRILENAVLNQGGEIEKRFAFVPMTTIPSNPYYIKGHGGSLHLFLIDRSDPLGSDLPPVVPGALPADVQLIPHFIPELTGDPITQILDVEPFDDKFYVCVRVTSGNTYCYYDGNLLWDPSTQTYLHGTYARTWKSKMYRTDGKYLRFSGINNPAQSDPASVTEPGAGFINLALNDPDGETVAGMEVFYQDMAVFAQLQTQIWTLDPDPTKDNLKQLIRTGIVAHEALGAPPSTPVTPPAPPPTSGPITPVIGAAHSIVQFGTGDVLFLSQSGVRSLKSQYITLAAAVSDVGSAIDLILVPIIRAGDFSEAFAIVQPIQGRYWLALGPTIYVLSYFPAGNITAWSTFNPGFTVQHLAVVGNMVYCTDDANNIYLYGGVDQNTYDSCKVVVRTPHMSAGDPTQNKRLSSVDIMCQGQWTVSIGMLPNATDLFELCATIEDNTYGLEGIPFAGYGTHFGVHLENEAPGPALLAALHFNINPGVTK